MTKGRLGKKRAAAASATLQGAKKPPKAIPVGAMARLASAGCDEPLPPMSYPTKKVMFGPKQGAS